MRFMVKSSLFDTEKLLLETDGVVNYSRENPFEVKPGVFLPIYINMKGMLKDFSARVEISHRLADVIGGSYDFICGMESGGSYYASGVADILQKPLLLFRKDEKNYGIKGTLVGDAPPKAASIAIIDDVFATGLTASSPINYFHGSGCKTKLFVIFTYGFDEELIKKLKTEGSALSNFDNLCIAGQETGKFSQDDVTFLHRYLSEYKANSIDK